MILNRFVSVSLFALVALLSSSSTAKADDAAAAVATTEGNYELSSPDHESLVVAMGCFWCGEQAFEQYAPGVVEAVSGYSGANGIDNPTYRNHRGHYEVVLVEYDPTKTSYEVLIDYAWKNIDPFNGFGQFCDRGFSYLPAIFYANEDQRLAAERVKARVLEDNPTWNEEDLVVPILPRPRFWIAEEYHQDYYIKNPGNYGYYKNGCGRPKRLKQVWGEDVYECYHDLEGSCFAMGAKSVEEEEEIAAAAAATTTSTTMLRSNTNNTTANGGSGVVVDEENEEKAAAPKKTIVVTNEQGNVVNSVEVNSKGSAEPEAALLPKKYWIVIGISVAASVLIMSVIGYFACCTKKKNYTH